MARSSGLALVLALAMVGSLLSIPALNVEAVQSGADEYGYRWTDNNSGGPTVAYDWVEISSTGTDTGIGGDDNYGGPYSIGFDFEFYGNVYSQFYVSTNGLVTFGSGYSTYSNTYIPYSSSPNNFIAAYWDDLCVDYSIYNNGVVYYEAIGISPNQQLVIEFHEVSRLSDYNLMTFEVILNETGEIWIQYETMSTMTGSSATVGIEDSTGGAGSQYSVNEAALFDGLAVMFDMSGVTVYPDQEAVDAPGASVDYTLDVANLQDVSDTIEIDYESDNGWTVEFFDNGMNPLTDSNANTVPDTGVLAAGGSATVIVRVTIPLSPTERSDEVRVNGSSFADPSIFDIATLTTYAQPMEFSPPHEEWLPDDDMDSLYDSLIVNVSFDTLFSDIYILYGQLSDAVGTFICDSAVYPSGGPGLLQAPLVFDGTEIFSSGLDGPYEVDLVLYDGNYTYMTFDTYTTSAYVYTDFERPKVMFGASHSESVLDPDLDGYHNYLVVEVSLEVYEEDAFYLYADLYDGFGGYITSAYNDTGTLAVGSQTVTMWLYGIDIRDSQEDGPYDVLLDLYDSSWNYFGADSHETAVYTWEEFQPRATFGSPTLDYGNDTDSDTYFNYLVVETLVNVSVYDGYSVDAYLYDSSWTWIDSDSFDQNLDVGSHSVTMVFDGLAIRTNGVDGPYYVEFYLYSYDTGYLEYRSYETGAYLLDEFELPDIVFESPHSDYGLDLWGSSLYEYLVVEVQVNVSAAGDYIIEGDLYDSGWSYVEYVENRTYLDAGLQVVELAFPSAAIYSNMDSGQYTVYLYAYDSSWSFWDSDSHLTSYYSYDEFQPSIQFSPPHSDYGLDTEFDGLYNYLVVEVLVTVSLPGDYYISGTLYDQYSVWLHNTGSWFSLSAGTQQVDLSFDGLAISDNGVDGPFTVYLYAYDDGWYLIDTDTHATGDYPWSDFQRPGAEFDPPYSDYGLDVNLDGSYDFLVIEVPVDIAIAGYYELDLYLYTPSWDYVGSESVTELLAVGPQVFEVYFPGLDIRMMGESGQFEVGFDLYDWSSTYIDTDWYTTGWYAWDDFTPPMGAFLPPHADYAVDMDGDTLYNYLVVEAVVDIAVEGSVEVYGELTSWWGGFICDAVAYEYVDVGIHVIELYFDGWPIRSYGADGSYTVELYMYDSYDNLLDYDEHYTEYYGWDEFETAPALLSPPYDSYGQDTGSDGLYDYLVIEVPVEVEVSGDYILDVWLYDDWWDYVADIEVEVSMGVGTTTVMVLFDGWTIRLAGLDGPYYFEMYLYDDSWVYLDYDYSWTVYYSWDDFQTADCEFEPPHSDYGLDVDDDGLSEYLVVNASVNASAAGSYHLWAALYDGAWNLIDIEFVDFTASVVGPGVVPLYFESWKINASGMSGAYHVELELDDSEDAWLDNDVYTTNPYLLTDFDGTVPMISSIWATTPPIIDGVYEPGEWADATPVALAVEYPADAPAATLLVMNNGTHLFICYDATGDTTEDWDDAASVSFDTGGDDVLTNGAEDQFLVGGTGAVPNSEAHYVYNAGWWALDCTPLNEFLTDHDGLAGAMGFGASDNSASDHRVFELAIPLALLGASLGDTIGLLGGSYNLPGVLDGSVPTYTAWPVYFDDIPEVTYYGDLRISSSSPPVTTADMTGTSGDNGWYLSSVEVALSADDDDEGVDLTMYNLDGQGWQEYTAPMTVSVRGTHVLQFYSVDNAGNAEGTKTVSIMIDLSAPNTTASVSGTVGEDQWYVSSASVTLTATDTSMESGIDNTMYRINSGAWMTYSGGSILLDEDGIYVIDFESEDVAGREEPANSITVKVDIVAPDTTMLVQGSKATFGVNDTTSGVNVTMYRIDGGEWIAYTGGEIDLGDPGNHTVEYYSVDNAGNVEDVTTEVVEVPSGGILGVPSWLFLLLLAIIAAAIAVGLIIFLGIRKRARDAASGPMVGGQTPAPPQPYGEQKPPSPPEPPAPPQ